MSDTDTEMAVRHVVEVPDAAYLSDLTSLPEKVDTALLKLEEPDATVDDVCVVAMRIDAMKDWIKEREATFKAAAKEWIERNGPFQFGTKRYFVGPEKKEQARDTKQCMETFLELAEGDMGALSDLLSVNSFKPGAAKMLLKAKGKPELFDKLFETTVKVNLKTEKTVRELQVIDTKFLPRD